MIAPTFKATKKFPWYLHTKQRGERDIRGKKKRNADFAEVDGWLWAGIGLDKQTSGETDALVSIHLLFKVCVDSSQVRWAVVSSSAMPLSKPK